jgi:hypothetical protein
MKKSVRLSAQDDANTAIEFWDWMAIAGPVAALALPLLLGWLLGTFENFTWIGQDATPLQAFLILGAMLFPCAAFLYAQREWNRAQARASRAWPTVQGVVQQSRIDHRDTQYGELYRLVLNYRYEVNDDGYEGDMAEFGPSWVKARELVEALANKYRVGEEVTVHYDPNDPKTAVLELSNAMATQNDWRVWLFVATPFICGIVAAILDR